MRVTIYLTICSVFGKSVNKELKLHRNVLLCNFFLVFPFFLMVCLCKLVLVQNITTVCESRSLDETFILRVTSLIKELIKCMTTSNTHVYLSSLKFFFFKTRNKLQQNKFNFISKIFRTVAQFCRIGRHFNRPISH